MMLSAQHNIIVTSEHLKYNLGVAYNIWAHVEIKNKKNNLLYFHYLYQKKIQHIYFYVCQSTHVMLCIRVCLLCPAWSNVLSSKKEEKETCHNFWRACVCMCILSVVFLPISPLETVDRFHESWYKLLSLLVTQISYFIISCNLIKAI